MKQIIIRFKNTKIKFINYIKNKLKKQPTINTNRNKAIKQIIKKGLWDDITIHYENDRGELHGLCINYWPNHYYYKGKIQIGPPISARWKCNFKNNKKYGFEMDFITNKPYRIKYHL